MLTDFAYLSVAKDAISTLLLIVSATQDVRKRQVDDRTWLAFLIFSIALNSLDLGVSTEKVTDWLIFAAIQSALFFAFWHLGAYGGADAKSLACLSLAYPTSIEGIMMNLRHARIAVALSTLGNAAFLSLVYIPVNLVLNLSLSVRGIELFEGLREEHAIRRLGAILLFRKVKASDVLRKPERFAVAEVLSGSGRGTRLLFIRDPRKQCDLGVYQRDDYVFVSYLVPFQVFILLGFLLYLAAGDILLSLVLRIFEFS